MQKVIARLAGAAGVPAAEASSRAGRIRGSDIKDISWFEPDGKEMTDEAWDAGFVQCLGVRLAGDLIGDVDERGEPIVGDTLLLLLNAHHEPIPFTLPVARRTTTTGSCCSTRPTPTRSRATSAGATPTGSATGPWPCCG